ncbi:hypothetical protein MRX96_038265 [Rhipicephalus microplus]
MSYHRPHPPEIREGSRFSAPPRSSSFLLTGTTPFSATSARYFGFSHCRALWSFSSALPSTGPAGSSAPSPSPPCHSDEPRQLILGGDVLGVYLQILVELQCPISCCSVRYSGTNWTSRVQSTHRHVEFEHLKPLNDRIYVC